MPKRSKMHANLVLASRLQPHLHQRTSLARCHHAVVRNRQLRILPALSIIAIPAMSGIFENSSNAKNRRNAQSIASLYSSLRAAGATVGTPGTATIAAALTLSPGVPGLAGTSFAGTNFYAAMTPTERDLAVTKLAYDSATDSLTVQ